VKGVEEKQVERSESADGAAGNEEQASIERVLVMLDFSGKPDRGEEDDRAEQDHEKTKSIHAQGEAEAQLSRNWNGVDELETARHGIETEKQKHAGPQCEDGRAERSHACWKTEHDQYGRDNWRKCDDKEH
jgi:hypothetical protein